MTVMLPMEQIDVESYLVPTEKGEYLDMAFANVDSDTFLFIRSEPTKESEWLGKLYPDYAAKIIGPVGEWTKVQSGISYRLRLHKIYYNRKQCRAKSAGADTECFCRSGK